MQYRLLFPLAPALAVLTLSFLDVQPSGRNAKFAVLLDVPAFTNNNPLPLSSQKIPLRSDVIKNRIEAPKFNVTFQALNRGGVDYDAGNQILSIVCIFNDLWPEQPVIGMSELGLLTRLQSDSGNNFEGASGYGIISPDKHVFKDAPFTLNVKMPLATKSIRQLNGAITVLRARTRSTLLWREPFGSEIGSVRNAGDFEFTLVKCEIANDFLTAEWSCKIPVEATREATLWQTRQLKAVVNCSDKSIISAEAAAQIPNPVRAVFRLNKKFPTSLELSFISELKLENLPFELSRISVDGSAPEKLDTSSGPSF